MFWEREHQMRNRSEGYIEHRVSKRPTRGEVKQVVDLELRREGSVLF